MKDRLLLLNQYYPPDVVSTAHYVEGVCQALAERGIAVDVVTAQPSYSRTVRPSAPRLERLPGIEVRRINVGRHATRESMATRLHGYVRYLGGALFMSVRLGRRRRYSGVMTFSNPPAIGWLGALVARFLRVPFVYVVFDIHPDVLIESGWVRLPRPVELAWRGINRRALKAATAIVVLGEAMRGRLVESGASPSAVHPIPLWARHEVQIRDRDETLRSELADGAALVVLYAGNMGAAQPVGEILKAADRLRHLPVRFLFTGEGALRARWEDEVARRGLPNVTFLPFQPDDRFADLLGIADACIVALRPGLDELSLPSRAFTFLCAGRPILALMSSKGDVAQLVKNHECGSVAEDASGLGEIVELLVAQPHLAMQAGRRARSLYETSFRRPVVTHRYVEVVSQALSSRGHRNRV